MGVGCCLHFMRENKKHHLQFICWVSFLYWEGRCVFAEANNKQPTIFWVNSKISLNPVFSSLQK